jgi:hypothetical protein
MIVAGTIVGFIDDGQGLFRPLVTLPHHNGAWDVKSIGIVVFASEFAKYAVHREIEYLVLVSWPEQELRRTLQTELIKFETTMSL